MEIESVILDKIRYAIRKAITKEGIEYLIHDNVFMDRYFDQLIVDLIAGVWSEKLQDEIEVVEYPTNAWEHVRKEWLPTLTFTNKYPVKMKKIKVRFERKAIYPKLAYVSKRNNERFYIIKENILCEE
uniref:Uncharacterized protein n=1 Tax=viral metagenome TaxID=1070528 RepID=A0A6M3XRL2_9ZZZZ